MLGILSAEFLKLRRSKALILSIIGCIVPSLIKYLQYTSGEKTGSAGWERFLSTGQELMVLFVIIIVILLSCFIFSMEYQYNTASYIFTSGSSKSCIYIAKLASLFVMIGLLFLVSFISQLCFGYLAVKSEIPGTLFMKLAEVTIWYISAYFLLSIVISMIVVITKRFVISTVIVFGYYMLVFPFHLKGNPYINPLMTPMAAAAKIYGSNDYILTGYYKDISVSIASLALFLVCLSAISLYVGMLCYKKLNAVK